MEQTETEWNHTERNGKKSGYEILENGTIKTRKRNVPHGIIS
jgi:hypothetical protein